MIASHENKINKIKLPLYTNKILLSTVNISYGQMFVGNPVYDKYLQFYFNWTIENGRCTYVYILLLLLQLKCSQYNNIQRPRIHTRTNIKNKFNDWQYERARTRLLIRSHYNRVLVRALGLHVYTIYTYINILFTCHTHCRIYVYTRVYYMS